MYPYIYIYAFGRPSLQWFTVCSVFTLCVFPGIQTHYFGIVSTMCQMFMKTYIKHDKHKGLTAIPQDPQSHKTDNI